MKRIGIILLQLPVAVGRKLGKQIAPRHEHRIRQRTDSP